MSKKKSVVQDDASAVPPVPEDLIQRIVQLYGDTLFDLCESVLWSTANAQVAFRAILRRIRKLRNEGGYREYERAWVLKIACDVLVDYAAEHGRRLSPPEQVMLDATLEPTTRLKQFDSYFHRLPTSEQLVLLMRDKYGLPYAEISAVLGLPEGSLKLTRQQALRTLEEWLWVQT